MQFVRAPDENVFIAPFNLIELLLLIAPFEWWMPRRKYQRLNDYVMGVIYSPLLLITAALETREAHFVKNNRRRGEEDDNTVQEWEQTFTDIDYEADGWDMRVQKTRPDVSVKPAVTEVKKLREEVKELRELLEKLVNQTASEGSRSS